MSRFMEPRVWVQDTEEADPIRVEGDPTHLWTKNPAMNSAAQPLPGNARRLTLFNPVPDRNTAQWKINGYPATIFIWTAEEWARLPEPPTDAQYYPCGVWCALRID
jgi:hypothetical protein